MINALDDLDELPFPWYALTFEDASHPDYAEESAKIPMFTSRDVAEAVQSERMPDATLTCLAGPSEAAKFLRGLGERHAFMAFDTGNRFRCDLMAIMLSGLADDSEPQPLESK